MGETESPRYKVLLVDDQDEVLNTLKLAFQGLNCELLLSRNGQDALHHIMQSQPDLIISDWYMPVMDGLNLFLQVKNSPYTKQIPFIFLTAKDDPEVRIALLELGVEDYWNKPFDIREVRVRAQRLFARLAPAMKMRSALPTEELKAASADDNLADLLKPRYELQVEISSGGMGVVYRAYDVVNNRDVALKLLRPEYVANVDAVRRFAREASAAMRIVHPNVIETFEYRLLASGQAYLAMELLQGISLDAELELSQRLPEARVIEIMRAICLGVGAAHKEGIIHRDLKPSNVFIVDTGGKPVIKVLDFGIALLRDQSESARITGPGSFMGTPNYIAPEQALALPLDGRSDIYALGILSYELLNGLPPFLGAATKVVMDQLQTKPIPIKELVPVTDWLADLVMQMIEKKPDQRPQTMEDIIARLDAGKKLNS